MQKPKNTLTGRYLAMHESHLRGRLANFLQKQQTTDAGGCGWRYNREQGEGKLFSVPRKVLSEFVLLAVLTQDRWTGREASEGGMGRAVAGLCAGLKQLRWRPLSVCGIAAMLHDYSAWLLICISFGTPSYPVCLHPGDKHT